MRFSEILEYNTGFLHSAMFEGNIFNSTSEIFTWIQERNRNIDVEIKRKKLTELEGWVFKDQSHSLKHKSGNFFSIEGINVKTNKGTVYEWDQPIINQPEVGFLGFITKEFDGVLYFLIQAKIEPGNVNHVQLSPTLQATKSNYTRVHGGKKPKYLEYFLDRDNNTVLLDQLQSEQGARFLKKRNRNIIIKVNSEIDLDDNFKWLTLYQIKQLIKNDNIVNMDTRTVISAISYGSYRSDVVTFYQSILSKSSSNVFGLKMLQSELDCENSNSRIDEVISWLTDLKTYTELDVTKIPLRSIQNWICTDYEIKNVNSKYFKVIGVDVTINNREVSRWNQPLIEPAQDGICAFVIKEINGIYHFLVQAKLECGNFDLLEMAPTVQCLTGNYLTEDSINNLPFLNYVLSVDKEFIIFDSVQSEEGGRFYREQNRNLIVLANERFAESLPENYKWLTLNQIKRFLSFNNYLNIQARSLISAITFN